MMNLGYRDRDSKLDRGEEGARIYQGGGAPNLFDESSKLWGSSAAPPSRGSGGSIWEQRRRSQKGGNFLVGGTWGRRRRRMRAQKGGARIYLFDLLSFWKVKVFWVMDSQHCILFSSWRGLFGERSQQYVDFYFVQKYKLKKNHYHHEIRIYTI